MAPGKQGPADYFLSMLGYFIENYYFIWKSSQDDSVLTWKYWETNHFDSVLNLEILENQSFWFSFEPGNTGKPVRMTQNNIILYGNPVRMIQNWPRILYGQYGPAGGRVGWLKSIGKESILGICILKKLNIVYIIESWLFGIFTKKTRAEKSRRLVRQMPRDLSYETHLGPKTKTD